MTPEDKKQARVLFIVALEDIIDELDKLISENETRIPVYMLGVTTVICMN